MTFGDEFKFWGGQFGPFPLMNRAQDHDTRAGGVKSKRSVFINLEKMLCEPVSRNETVNKLGGQQVRMGQGGRGCVKDHRVPGCWLVDWLVCFLVGLLVASTVG